MSSEKRNIIVPVDFSDQSKIAVNQTYNLAKMAHADITLLHVIDEALFKTFLHLFKNNDEHEAMIREEAKMKLEEFANEARAKSGLVFNCRVERGKNLRDRYSRCGRIRCHVYCDGNSWRKFFKEEIYRL
jgi:nucleotide-binding universal stress UspA family protein